MFKIVHNMSNGKPFAVNLCMVSMIVPFGDGARLFFDDGYYENVEERVAEILPDKSEDEE